MRFRNDSDNPVRQNRHSMEDLLSVITTDNREREHSSRFRTFLFGRQEQVATVRAACDRTSGGKSELVCVHGVSGTGKSSLVESMREIVMTNDAGCFVSGKFDLLQTSREPYSAIAAAFSDICDIILQSENPMDERRAALVALGPECKILSRVVSNISNITGEECGNEPYTVGNEDFACFMLACKQFLCAVATDDHPLLIFFDDVQWADAMSFRLIEALLRSDTDSRNVLFCLAYRDDEVNVRSRLHLDLWGPEHLSFSEIEVTNLDISDLTSMLSTLLLRKADSIESLVMLIHEKTKGNPHSVVQLLEYLETKGLLYFTSETDSWDWNIDGIEAEVSDSPSELVANKVKCLDSKVQELLRLAAFVGHTFEVDVLRYILVDETFSTDKSIGSSLDDYQDFVIELVNVACDSGLLIQVGPGVFKFSHDSIQYFLYQSVTTVSERDKVHLVIGRGLLKMVSCARRSDDERLVLLAASNLTKGYQHITHDGERTSTMQLLLRAATLAARKASVENAREFLECGVSLINESDWSVNYDICMDLQNSYAEASSCAGFFAKSDAAIAIVLDRATRLEDKIRAQNTKIRSFGYRHDVDGMLDWAFNVVLRGLGVRIPKRPSVTQVLVELCRTKMALRRVKPNDFLLMPSVEDPKKLSVMMVLNLISPFLAVNFNERVYLYCALLEMRITVKYGVCAVTAASLARYAVILRGMGNADDAYRWGKVAVELCSHIHTTPIARSIVLVATSVAVFPWRQLLAGLEEPLLSGYRNGLESTSDLALAFMALSCYSCLRLHLGVPLRDVEEELRRWCRQMKECQATQMWRIHAIRWQYVLNLVGRSDDPVVLTGEAMDETNHLEPSGREGESAVLYTFYVQRFTLLLSFEDWDGLEKAFPDAIFTQSKMSVHFDVMLFTTQIVMGALVLYGWTTNVKYRRIAQRFMKIIRKWFLDTVPDVQPLWKLINAEWDAIVKKKDTTAAFDDAIEDLRQCRLIVFETMAYQRVLHLKMAQSQVKKARHYFTLLIGRCREWGNVAKVEWLEDRYGKVLQDLPTIEVQVPGITSY